MNEKNPPPKKMTATEQADFTRRTSAAIQGKDPAPVRPTFYLVQREGVGRGRGIVGIFTTEAKAEEAARAAAAEEPDAYFEFACYVVQSNMRVTLSYSPYARDDAAFVLKRRRKSGGDGYENVVERPA